MFFSTTSRKLDKRESGSRLFPPSTYEEAYDFIDFSLLALISFKTIDGNDVVSMYKLLKEVIKKMRTDNKPFFLEAFTYRWKGHVGHRDDNDVGVTRKDDLNKWKKRDPIKRLSNSMIKKSIISVKDLKNLELSIKYKIDKDWENSLASDFPPDNFLLDPVYNS